MTQTGLTGAMLPAPMDGGFRMEGYWIWCGSVIQSEDGRYHMFASRWPKDYCMHPGWLYKSEIVRAVSATPEGPYTFQEVVLPSRGADYWDGMATHNPAIFKCSDTYVLYYTGITYPFVGLTSGNTAAEDDKYLAAQGSKRIGIATSKSIYGPWERRDNPLLNVRPGMFDSFLTSNPAPCVNADGSVLLIYKARKHTKDGMGKMTLGVAKASRFDGPYDVRSEEPIFPPEDGDRSKHGAVEDPFIWKTEDGYRMIAKDMTGDICGELYGGILASSEDGFHWSIHRGIKAYSRTILWEDGITRTMGSFERPFLLIRDGVPTHLFAATADGPCGFDKAGSTWNMVIPLARK